MTAERNSGVAQLFFIKINVAVDGGGQARLSGFGLLSFFWDSYDPSGFPSTFAHDWRWLSPELIHQVRSNFKRSRPTKESDLYALGMVIFEVLSGEGPFLGEEYAGLWKGDHSALCTSIIRGVCPKIPTAGARFPDALWRIAEQCWSHNPKDRPTPRAVIRSLEKASKL